MARLTTSCPAGKIALDRPSSRRVRSRVKHQVAHSFDDLGSMVEGSRGGEMQAPTRPGANATASMPRAASPVSDPVVLSAELSKSAAKRIRGAWQVRGWLPHQGRQARYLDKHEQNARKSQVGGSGGRNSQLENSQFSQQRPGFPSLSSVAGKFGRLTGVATGQPGTPVSPRSHQAGPVLPRQRVGEQVAEPLVADRLEIIQVLYGIS